MDANFLDAPPDRELEGVTLWRVGKHAGGEALGASAYELEPGAQWAEVLHFHHANEELLIVVEGTPTVHRLDGSRELRPGDVVAFPAGRRGAHRMSNESDAVARFVVVSTTVKPEVIEYPETGRVLVMSEDAWDEAEYDPDRGRIIRFFAKADGEPVPPDA